MGQEAHIDPSFMPARRPDGDSVEAKLLDDDAPPRRNTSVPAAVALDFSASASTIVSLAHRAKLDGGIGRGGDGSVGPGPPGCGDGRGKGDGEGCVGPGAGFGSPI